MLSELEVFKCINHFKKYIKTLEQSNMNAIREIQSTAMAIG